MTFCATSRLGCVLLLAALLGACDYFPAHLLAVDGGEPGADLVLADGDLALADGDLAPQAPLFDDDFDDGTLGKWTLSGNGKPWHTSTAKPRKGTHAATASKTDGHSYMEAAFTAPAKGSLTLSYQRLLLGLDAADDFSAEVLDQGAWIALERLGTSSATDADYVAKSFTIPGTATKIRFGCDCNAASESCNVESVSVRLK